MVPGRVAYIMFPARARARGTPAHRGRSEGFSGYRLKLTGGPMVRVSGPSPGDTAALQLRRLVLERGRQSRRHSGEIEIAGAIAELLPKVPPAEVAALAIEARTPWGE